MPIPMLCQVLVTAKDWPQREAFLATLRRRLGETQQRMPWYPGSNAKHAAFQAQFPQVSQPHEPSVPLHGTRSVCLMETLDKSTSPAHL